MNVTCFLFSFSYAYQKSDNILFLLGSVSLESTNHQPAPSASWYFRGHEDPPSPWQMGGMGWQPGLGQL